MTSAVLFDDAEARTINYLRPLLGVTVVSAFLKPTATTVVTVQRVGGAERNEVVDQPMLVVECWGGSKAIAHDLAQLAWAYLRALAGGAWVDGVWCYRADTVGGPGYQPDPDTGHHRYTFTMQLGLRGQGLYS